MAQVKPFEIQQHPTYQGCYQEEKKDSSTEEVEASVLVNKNAKKPNTGTNHQDSLNRKTRRSNNICLFCSESSSKGNPLFKAVKSNEFIRENAQLIQNETILEKFSAAASIDTFYHNNCYTRFRNIVRSNENSSLKDESNNFKVQVEALALAGLISYINECGEIDNIFPTFSMAALLKVYLQSMKELGGRYKFDSTEKTTS